LISVHPLTWLIAAAAAAIGMFAEALCLVTIVFIHELGHAAAAKYCGWRIVKIELLPFGGKLETNEHAGRPAAEEWLVVLAGPFMHIPMTVIALFLLNAGIMEAAVYSLFFQLNLLILFFNLLPVLPLDGGKMLLLLLSAFRPYHAAYRLAIHLSFFMLVCLFGAAVYFLPFYIQLILTVSYVAVQLLVMWKEKEYMFIRFLTARFYEPVPLRVMRIQIGSRQSLIEIVRLFRRNRTHLFIVDRKESITESSLLTHYFKGKKMVDEITGNND
jgi:stage IV sporulation protein FB